MGRGVGGRETIPNASLSSLKMIVHLRLAAVKAVFIHISFIVRDKVTETLSIIICTTTF